MIVAAEAEPFASSGNLGRAVGGLSRAVARLGHHVDLVIPRYRGVTAGQTVTRVSVALGGQVAAVDVSAIEAVNLRTILIDHPQYFDRDYLYGAGGHDYADNPERFAFLCQAALTWAVRNGERYDVIHAHDWHTGLLPVLLGRMFRSHAALHRMPVVFTIHDIAYQGLFDASWLPRLGLEWDLMRMDALEFWGRISFLKAGIVFSRLITTVSPRYAEEIKAAGGGAGFEGLLRERSVDLIGILNGIDYDQWNPARDPNLQEPFHASNVQGKAEVKRLLLRELGFPDDEATMRRPLVAVTTRLFPENGLELLEALADELPRLGATFAQLGSGERRYEDLWLALAARHPERVSARISEDRPMLRRLIAGADLILIPARFAPSGVEAMCALRYGTVPVVHASGGLADVVRNFDPAAREGTGFSFEEYSPQALLDTLRWALEVFGDRRSWDRIRRAGMEQDFSWDRSAREYALAYERAAAHAVWA